jgi:crotonobetainyl-CoA:carnitine CoA-transferase CaiB-like acyl-CoA transferase
VPASPLRDVGEAFAHEQTRALGILQQLGGGTTVSPPLTVDGEHLRHHAAPPARGADGAAILEELGFRDDEIRALVHAGVVSLA